MLKNTCYIIFDLDGTVIDSNNVQNNLDVKLVHLFDKDISKKEILEERNNVFKNSHEKDIYLDYCDYLKRKYNLDLSNIEILEKRRELERKAAVKVRLKDGVDKLINYLKEKNIHLALATVSRRETINIYMNKNKNIGKKLDFNKFDLIITKDDVKLKKPNPEIYLKIIKELNIKDLTKCLVIEDSLSGVIAANKAGLNVIGIYDKYSSCNKEEIIKYTKYYANNYDELIEYFKSELEGE